MPVLAPVDSISIGFPSRRTMLMVTFAAFLLIGVPEGVLGTAWPEIRDSVGRSTSDLGLVLVTYTGGYLLASLLSGHLAERLGLGQALVTAASASMAGGLVFALTGLWAGVLIGAFLMACGSGITDSGLNTYLTLHHDARAMNTAHGLFGVGATLGPLAIEASLRGGASWEIVYIGMSMASAVLVLLYLAHRDIADTSAVPIAAETAEGRDARLLVAALLAVFLFYVAAEASVGAWTFSLLTESRGVDDTVGRIFVSAFWAGLTLGRFGLGWLGHHLHLRSLLRLSVVGTGIGVAALSFDPFPGADLLALPVTGLAMAGVFPALVLLTPGWLGSGRTARIVGYQLAASSLGAVGAAAFTRQLVEAHGESAIAAALATAAAGLMVTFGVLDRLAPRRRADLAAGAAV